MLRSPQRQTVVPCAGRGPGKSRGAENGRALPGFPPQQAFSADLYGVETTWAAVVEALERHDKLLICADAGRGALLEARLENLPGAEKRGELCELQDRPTDRKACPSADS